MEIGNYYWMRETDFKTEFNNSDSIYIYYDNKWGKILDPVSQVEVNEIINNYQIY